MSKPTVTLEEYLRSEMASDKIDFSIRSRINDGRVTFYIHPDGRRDGQTVVFFVDGNNLSTVPKISFRYLAWGELICGGDEQQQAAGMWIPSECVGQDIVAGMKPHRRKMVG